jgi:hypothetical protein
VKTPKQPIAVLLRLGVDFLSLLMHLYLPFLRRNKIPTREDCKIVNLINERQYALVFSARRYLIEGLHLARRLNRLDLKRIEHGVEMYASGVATLFSWGGLSFKLARKILDFLRGEADERDADSAFMLRNQEMTFDCLCGHWGEKYVNLANGNLTERYNENMVNYWLDKGRILHVNAYYFIYMVFPIEQGYFKAAQELWCKLWDIANEYEADFVRTQRYTMYTRLLLKFRYLKEVLIELEAGILFSTKSSVP